jgi:hypothetical protein
VQLNIGFDIKKYVLKLYSEESLMQQQLKRYTTHVSLLFDKALRPFKSPFKATNYTLAQNGIVVSTFRNIFWNYSQRKI